MLFSVLAPLHLVGVVEALENFEFDGMGNGKTLYRGDDHQCFKDVLVVKGKENPTSEFDVLEVVEVTPRCPGRCISQTIHKWVDQKQHG